MDASKLAAEMKSAIKVKAPRRDDVQTGLDGGAKLRLANGRQVVESEEDRAGWRAAQKEYKLSPERWRFLLAMVVLTITDVLANEHTCLLSLHVDSLEMELPDYVNLYQSLFFIPIVAPFCAAQLIEAYGLKRVIWGTFSLCCLRNVARILLFSPTLPHWRQLRFLYWILMRASSQTCYSVFTTMPLKISEIWFPESERSLALSAMLTAPAVGLAGGTLIYPRLVTGLDNCHWLKYFNAGALLVAFGGLLAGVRRSEPAEGPPSSRCDLKQRELKASQAAAAAAGATSGNRSSLRGSLVNFVRQMRRVCGNTNLLIQMVAICMFEKMLMAVFMVVQDIFNGAGLSNVFTGGFISLQMIVACLMQLGVSSRLKPKPNPLDPYNTRTCKLLLLAKMVTFLAFTSSLVVHELECLANYADFIRRHQWLLLIATSLALTLAINCAKPFFNEQTAELILGVTTEANASACQNAMGAIIFNVMAFAFVRLRQVHDESRGGLAKPSQEFDSTTMTTLSDTLLDGTAEGGGEPPESANEVSRPLYLRSMVLLWLVAIPLALLYLLKFDSSSARRRKRARQQPLEQVPGRNGIDNEPNGLQVIRIEMTKL